MDVILVDTHAAAPPASPGAEGRAVLSSLPRGASRVWGQSLSVKYVIDGEERYTVNGHEHVVRPDSFLVIEQAVLVEAVLPRPSLGFCLSLPPGQGRHAPMSCEDGLVLQAGGTPFGELLQRCAARVASGEHERASEALAAMATDLPGLLAEATEAMAGIGAARDRTRRDGLARLERARAFALTQDDRAISIEELASRAGMSSFHFVRRFGEAYGEAPGAFHRRVRLSRALRELRGGASVSDAANAVGFDHAGSFSRAFLAWAGIRPSAVGAVDDGVIERILRDSGAPYSRTDAALLLS